MVMRANGWWLFQFLTIEYSYFCNVNVLQPFQFLLFIRLCFWSEIVAITPYVSDWLFYAQSLAH